MCTVWLLKAGRYVQVLMSKLHMFTVTQRLEGEPGGLEDRSLR